MSIIHRLKNKAVKMRRSLLGRELENQFRFSGKKFVALGDTNSSFYRPGWKTLDLIDADYIVDFRKEPLPFDNETLDAVHSSHMIEHISYDDGIKLFQEIYRCLKPGGYLRLATPDMDLLLERYQIGDWRFFLQADGSKILKRICKGDLLPESILLHNLLTQVASYPQERSPEARS
jgi:SAM-dependent methyltransferase